MSQDKENSQAPAEMMLVASLRFEVPVNPSSSNLSSGSGGTVNLDEVETDSPVIEEVVTLREGDTFRLGRARDNDLVIQNNAVSRFHAMFNASSSGLVISDLTSLNGTFHNGRKISTPVNLSTGDEVKVGNIKIGIDMHLGSLSEDSGSHLQTQSTAMKAVLVTVLVTDIAKFTTMSQQLPPKEMAEMLDKWFGEVTSLIESEGGEIDKYIGDCVMALWRSTPEQLSQTAAASIRVSKEILALTKRMSDEHWMFKQQFPWQCRVALNTGEALMGSIGGKGARDFTVLGDTVNVAFRLEGVGAVKGWPITISASTAEPVLSEFELVSMGSVIVQGRSDTVEVYTLKNSVA